MIAVVWRVGVRDLHEHVLEVLDVPLAQAEAHREDGIGLQASRVRPLGRYHISLLVDRIASSRNECRVRLKGKDSADRSGKSEENHFDEKGTLGFCQQAIVMNLYLQKTSKNKIVLRTLRDHGVDGLHHISVRARKIHGNDARGKIYLRSVVTCM